MEKISEKTIKKIKISYQISPHALKRIKERTKIADLSDIKHYVDKLLRTKQKLAYNVPKNRIKVVFKEKSVYLIFGLNRKQEWWLITYVDRNQRVKELEGRL